VIVHHCRYVLPIAGPPIESGAVAVEGGRILAVGRTTDVDRAVGGGADIRDHGDAVLLPGLVNAHTHLELSFCRRSLPPGQEFPDWVRSLVALRRSASKDAVEYAAILALTDIVDRGTVAVGDHSNEDWIAPIVARFGLAGVCFHELLGFRSADAQARIEDATARRARLEGDPDLIATAAPLRRALTPHAIYSTSPILLTVLAERAAAEGAPFSIHVAESEAESELTLQGTGPFVALLQELGAWDETWRAPGVSPVRALDRLGALTPRTLAVHCVQVDRGDIEILRAREVTVVTCPRSNAHLGVGKAPIPEIVASGARVALGTDSLASAPDLDLFAEMAALRSEHPGLAPEEVLRMATLHGAAALGIDGDFGTLEPGKRAALLCVPLDGARDPLEVVTSVPATVTRP